MFRAMHSDKLPPKEVAAPAPNPGLSVTTLRHAHQESPWVGILSVVSRPALAFLQKYLPGSTRASTVSNGVSDWQDVGINRPFKSKNVLLDQLEFAHKAERHLANDLHYQSSTNSISPSSTAAVSWLSADSLRELGINDGADMDVTMRQQTSSVGYFTSAKNFLSHVLVNAVSGQDATVKNPEYHRGLGRDDWPTDPVSVASRVKSNWLWDGIWGYADSSQGWLSSLSLRACSVASHQHCGENDSGVHCQRAESGTPAGVAKPTELFEQRDYGEPIHGENAGPSSNKGLPDNDSRQSVRPESLPSSQKAPLVCQPVFERLTGIRAATACSEVAVLTPDQDNGYSSLEEEHWNSRMCLVEPVCPEQACPGPGEGAEEAALPALEGCESGDPGNGEPSDAEATSAGEGGEEASDDGNSDLSDTDEESEPEAPTPPCPQAPACQNKAIAFIMGGPCSEEDSESDPEEEDGGDWDSQDDDGFDSEGSSDLCDSEDPDDEEEREEEADGEVEQLLNSFCRSGDPYDPRNFTAALWTAPPPPSRGEARAEEEEECPEEGCCSPHPLLSEEEEEEESWEEASDVDEAESLRLWASFSSPDDPYNPLNFQGPLWTRDESHAPGKRPAATSARPARPPPPCTNPDAEDRMDSGFSEVLAIPDPAVLSVAKPKKVRFAVEVEEFYTSGDEDRHGPWEEFARDRCRFLRRVQETEDAIGYCLSPDFRLCVFARLHSSC